MLLYDYESQWDAFFGRNTDIQQSQPKLEYVPGKPQHMVLSQQDESGIPFMHGTGFAPTGYPVYHPAYYPYGVPVLPVYPYLMNPPGSTEPSGYVRFPSYMFLIP
ncbi:hypothetical protein LSG31_13100 [Fodinisporobacter ferrooxydans]|uniref:Uncharacterized protein n=1 Tax=Fodinisporobacter ferrooxydans TaxID=2901836 RepID=A0ABY4CEC4_9BACL|nr:hypothetical protein LSG31_13100 [Alicyclobacillaceae bacterium MYW30-H2]